MPSFVRHPLLPLSIGLAIIIALIVANVYIRLPSNNQNIPLVTEVLKTTAKEMLPFSIEALKQKKYPGSPIVIEETLAPGTNYDRYIASYQSDGLKIHGLYTIPKGERPTGGWPAIVFIHGHLDPVTYQTTERYVAYQDGFARSGFVTFKPDLRGHGKLEGTAVSASFSDGYVSDAMNLIATFKLNENVNPQRIGMWGHSMGGGITLRTMVVSKDIKAGVIWAGVVGDYEDLLQRYQSRSGWLTTQASSNPVRELYEKYGSPSANPTFWNQIDPYAYLSQISGPIQLDHGTKDESVPLEFSEHLRDAMLAKKKVVEYYQYEGSDHNIALGFSLAMQRSVDFFKKYL